MRKFTEKDIEKISGAIITSFTNLHYLEEVSRLGVIKHIAKKNLSRTLEDLKLIEIEYFNQIENLDEDALGDKMIANKMSFVEFLLNDFSFNDFSKFQEIACAYKLDPKRVTGITDKILLENGAEKV
mgnify:CR=1 FL=1|tara:strand:- start:7706 stop:8086 length:381 start_codon:yes stop_codon:yes gene_type:complete